MFKKVGIGLVILVLAFLAVVAVQPATFRIERSREVAAPAWVVFNIVNNFHRWPAWSPWEKLDPGMQKQHSGAETGTGAVYEWSGNDDVGKGRMTITESIPPEKITIRLEFMEPWQATNTTLFSFSGKGKESKVIWAMEGKNDFMGKAMSLFMDMDSMVGKDFEAGLAELEKVALADFRELEKKKSEKADPDEMAAQAVAEAMAETAPQTTETVKK